MNFILPTTIRLPHYDITTPASANMRRLVDLALRRRKNVVNEVTAPQSEPPEPIIIESFSHVQEQSILFSMLSADIRLLIHEEALSDPMRMLHIVSYRGKQRRPVMGHWHCTDQDSEFPLWQHSCFGIYLKDNKRMFRREPRSNSNLVAWMLTCRRVYLEAIDILYAVNEMNFRGATGLLRFQSQLHESNWNRIRRLSISTIFMVPMRMAPARQFLPPENYASWKDACESVGRLQSLRSFTVDIVFRNWYDGQPLIEDAPQGVEIEAFICILGPINAIKADEVVVAMREEIPDAVADVLGPLNFKVEQRNRPDDDYLLPIV